MFLITSLIVTDEVGYSLQGIVYIGSSRKFRRPQVVHRTTGRIHHKVADLFDMYGEDFGVTTTTLEQAAKLDGGSDFFFVYLF